MFKITGLAFLLSVSAMAAEPRFTGDLCRDTIGIRAATMLAKFLKVSGDIAFRNWTGHEPGRAVLVNELDDKEIYEVNIDTGRVTYRMNLMRQNDCDLSLVWMEKE